MTLLQNCSPQDEANTMTETIHPPLAEALLQ
jgi:hypothetical protein